MNRQLATMMVILVVVLGGAALLASLEPSPVSSPGIPIDTSKLLIGSSYIRGAYNAPITVYQFGEFQCSECSAAEAVIQDVMSVGSSTIRIVFKHFPLAGHAHAELAALAAESAGVQGKFWQMCEMLYERSIEWQEARDVKAVFTSYAKNLGLNVEQFKRSLDDATLKEKIIADAQLGQTIGVRGTPSFIIEQKLFRGMSPELIKEINRAVSAQIASR